MLTAPLTLRAITLMLGLFTELACASESDCKITPPILSINATSFYTDARASVPDPHLVAKYQRDLAPVRDVLAAVEKGIDGAMAHHEPKDARCAVEQLESWAAGESLSARPANLQAVYERSRFVRAFAIAALKARSIGAMTASPLVNAWLEELARADRDKFVELPKLRNNLYYWAGAETAAVALLTGAEDLAEFSDRVWADAIASAAPDGSFPQELARGQRAITYQLHATNALIVLDQLRHARGAILSPSETDRWARILSFTYNALCYPETIERATGVHQEVEAGRPLAPLTYLDRYLPVSPPACVPKPDGPDDPNLGGDLELAEEAIAPR